MDVERTNISLYEFHINWIERRRQEDSDFNFSEWVREQIEEDAQDAPAHL